MRGVVPKGKSIRKLRRALGMTQEQLAATVGCDVKTIPKAEKGTDRVDMRIVVSLATALNSSVSELIVASEADAGIEQRNLAVVREWREAFFHGDIDALLPMHTDDTILEIPGSEDLPEAGAYRGIEQVRGHFEAFFRIFQLVWHDTENGLLSAAGDHVFMRNEAEIEYLPSGKSYRARHVNEFEFRDGKIARRIVTADYEKLREILGET